MPAASGAYVIKNGALSVDGTAYSNQVWRTRLVPEQNIQTQRTLVPDGTLTDVDSAVWTLELTGISDYETGGLAKYLHDNAGEEILVVVTPKAGGVSASATCLALESSFGGTAGEWHQFELELPVRGQPTFSND